ncbi:MAG: MBL fold metallo-hydrolase [Bacilli bacterium]|nr:MBL fold metallo-hydrolase [Bacilli bacterium]
MGMNIMQALNSKINIKRIVGFQPFDANCYLISDGKDAIVIDPCIPYKEAKEALKGKTIRAVFVTHGHIDHFYFLQEYIKGEIEAVYYHPKAYDKMSNLRKSYAVLTPQKIAFTDTSKSVVLVDHQLVTMGAFQILPIFTPGHSNCSVSYLLGEHLFTGDTLFYQSVGRTDLYTSSSTDLSKSLKMLITECPDVILYPGHEDITTMKEEIESNPYLKEIT